MNDFNAFNLFGVAKKLSTYNPLINYTWEMLPNAKVKNSGTSGVDLQLYSGNPLDFQATQGIQVNKSFTLSGNAISLFLGFDTDSIAITHTLAEFDNLKVSIVNAILRVTINAVNHDVATLVKDTYYQTEIVINSNNLTVKLNGTQTYSSSCTALSTTILKSIGANDGLASGRFDGQFDYFIAYNGLTTFSLPNQFFKDMSTVANTLFATDFRGNADYIADSKNYSVGASNLFTGGVYITGSVAAEALGVYTLTSVGSTIGWFAFHNSSQTTTMNIKVSFNFKLKSGSTYPLITGYQTSAGTKTLVQPYQVKEGLNTLNIENWTNIRLAYFRIVDITEAFVWEISSIDVKQVSGVYPITNYSATQRTNFTQVNKGLQDLTRSFDSNGFFVDNVSYLNCNGKGYGNTGWIPSTSKDWTIEVIMPKAKVNTYEGIGIENGVDSMWIRRDLGSSTTVRYGNGLVVSLQNGSNNAYIYICCVLNNSINTVSCFSNSVYSGASQDNSVAIVSNFTLGKINKRTDKNMNNPLRLFKVHNKALTQEEITINYNSYVAQGLLS